MPLSILSCFYLLESPLFSACPCQCALLLCTVCTYEPISVSSSGFCSRTKHTGISGVSLLQGDQSEVRGGQQMLTILRVLQSCIVTCGKIICSQHLGAVKQSFKLYLPIALQIWIWGQPSIHLQRKANMNFLQHPFCFLNLSITLLFSPWSNIILHNFHRMPFQIARL